MANVNNKPQDVENQALVTSGSRRSFLHLTAAEVESAGWVAVWLATSAAVIIMNKWILTMGGFPYPLALTSMHMGGCFLVFGSVRLFAPKSLRDAMMPDAEVAIPWPEYLKTFGMISVLFAVSIGASNMAYLYCSIAFLQMVKPINSVTTSLAAFAIGVDVPTSSHIIIVGIVFSGVTLSASSATDLSMVGLALQLISSSADGCRLALLQTVTSHNLQLDPVTTVYHYSFVSAILLALTSLAWERPFNLVSLHNPWILVANVALAVMLNVIAAMVIKKTSAVAFALSGCFKDMFLVLSSSFTFGTLVTVKQLCGWALALSGIGMFKHYKGDMAYFKQYGFIEGICSVIRGTRKPS